MDRSFADLLVDPESKTRLELEVGREDQEGDVVEGVLRSASSEYPILDGIPRFVSHDNEDQEQTEQSFGYKWQRLSSYDSPSVEKSVRDWIVERYGFESVEAMRDYFRGRQRILDAGCGGGFATSVWMGDEWDGADWVGADISAAIDVARDRLGSNGGTAFVQSDLMKLPFADATFDTIFCEGVMHHTPSTEAAIRALSKVLSPGGDFLFYVYRKKGPVREFTDDYVRRQISDLEPEEAWEQIVPLTELGRALAELGVEVDVPDVPVLGIKAGRYDIQRLIYWNFAKLFWNPEYSPEQNTHVNFDWYHPKLAHRHTVEEVRSWCDDLGLRIEHLDVQESGLTVRAVKE